MNILDQIVASTRRRVERDKQVGLPEPVHKPTAPFAFEQALKEPGMSFICEVKKASPSKGVIARHFPYVEIAKEYQAAGASAISVLTEPEYFQGHDRYLREIRQAVTLPLLRKDFVVDSFQIQQSARLGADAILLICSVLASPQLAEFIQMADELGLSCLVEAHDAQEVQAAVEAGARIIGVNNRNLKTFEVDTANSIRLRGYAPAHTLFVSESGIRTAADIEALHSHNIDAVLVGEALMRSPNKGEELARLKGDRR